MSNWTWRELTNERSRERERASEKELRYKPSLVGMLLQREEAEEVCLPACVSPRAPTSCMRLSSALLRHFSPPSAIGYGISQRQRWRRRTRQLFNLACCVRSVYIARMCVSLKKLFFAIIASSIGLERNQRPY